MSFGLEVGNTVLFGTQKGVVRFLGAIPDLPGTWAGVELEAPVGTTDGVFNGVRYFTCQPGFAIFARAETFANFTPPPYDPDAAPARTVTRVADDSDDDSAPPQQPALSAADSMSNLDPTSAAIKIQSLIRGHQGRAEFKEKRFLDAWYKLDTKEESELVQTRQQYEKLTSLYKEHSRGVDALPQVQGAQPTEIEEPDNCPRLGAEITLDFVTAMMDHFKQEKLLRYEDVLRLLAMVKPILTECPNVVEIPVHIRMTVVGDLHGQLDDLLSIFKLNGLPSLRNSYLFNGDFVDRGQYSVEVVLVLFAFKVLYPNNVFLNRGNHEARDINSRDGFENEVTRKYDHEIFEVFCDVFASLPLASVLGGKIYVVHGGLTWEDLKISDIQTIDRFHEIPPMDSPMEQMMWSDPHDKPGREENPRGCALVFGHDVVQTFCAQNDIKLVVRSHECKHEGFEMQFEERLVTIFSASNYCGVAGNKGAFMVVLPDLSFQLVQYEAKPKEKLSRARMRHAAIENDVISKLLRRIAQNRLALVDYYQRVDDERTGTITRLQWAEGLKAVLGVDIPFLEFQSYLGLPKLGVSGREEGSVDYMNFLERYRIHLTTAIEEKEKPQTPDPQLSGPVLQPGAQAMDTEVSRALEQVVLMLYKNRFELESLFRYFDVNGDGVISIPEFRDGVLSLRASFNEPLSESQVDKLISFMDRNNDKAIQYDEFFNCFEIADPQLRSALNSAKSAKPPLFKKKSLPQYKLKY